MVQEVPRELVEKVVEWFRKHGRDFPWRKTSDWYRVIVAEFMLIRTRAEVVNRVYREFLERFPTPEALCSASDEDVEAIFKKIGLVKRGKRIRELVCKVLSDYGGRMPCRYEELVELPGVGDYLASIVLTVVCNEPRPFIDTNVERVLTRVLGLASLDPKQRRSIIASWLSAVPRELLKEFNVALLDIAAMLCKPAKPRCEDCPLSSWCSYARSVKQY